MIEREDRLSPDEAELAAALSRVRGEDLPSPALDAAILAAARHAVATTAGVASPAPTAQRGPAAANRRRPRARVAAGLGIAASVLLAAGLSWQMRPKPEDTIVWSEAPQSGTTPGDAAAARMVIAQSAQGSAPPDASAPAEPAGAATASQASPLSARGVPSAEPAPDQQEQRAVERQQAMADVAVGAPAKPRESAPAPAVAAPAPPAPPAPSTVPEQAVDAAATALPAPPAEVTLRRDAPLRETSTQAARLAGGAASAPRDMPRRADAVGNAPPAPVASDAAEWDQPFDDQPPASADSPDVRRAWLARIRELMDSEQYEAARASLAEFQRRYPEDAVPPELAPLQE